MNNIQLAHGSGMQAMPAVSLIAHGNFASLWRSERNQAVVGTAVLEGSRLAFSTNSYVIGDRCSAACYRLNWRFAAP